MLRVWITITLIAGTAAFAEDPNGLSNGRLMKLPTKEAIALETMRKGLKSPIFIEPSNPSGSDVQAVATEITRRWQIHLPTKPLLTKLVPEYLAHWLVAAESGDADAQFVCGMVAQAKLGKNHGDKGAVDWYRKASTSGHDAATIMFARALITGEGVNKDRRYGLDLLKKLADRGHSEAQYDLALEYLEPTPPGEANPVEAIRLLAKAAAQGHPSTMSTLGHCLQIGKGIQQDPIAAAEWHAKSIEYGSTLGMLNFGYCYAMGIGVNKDDKKCFEWTQRAASAGNAAATRNLADCYFVGRGVPADRSEGLRLFNLASDMGDKKASEWLRAYNAANDYRPFTTQRTPNYSRAAHLEAQQAASEAVRNFRSHIYR